MQDTAVSMSDSKDNRSRDREGCSIKRQVSCDPVPAFAESQMAANDEKQNVQVLLDQVSSLRKEWAQDKFTLLDYVYTSPRYYHTKVCLF